MDFSFQAALATIAAGAAFRIAAAARPPASRILATLLPEENHDSYHIDTGGMTVRPTMAGLVGMDSPYPPTGYAEISSFLENTAKIANSTTLKEATLRHIQESISRLRGRQPGVDPIPTLVNEALNFYNTVVIAPQLDASEWLRGQAIAFGAINWQFNKKGLTVDYGIPLGNIGVLRTLASNTAYSGSASAFWADVAFIRKTLRRTGVRVILAHPDTIDQARFNPVNQMVVTAGGDGNGPITFRKIIPSTGAFTQDAGDTVTIVPYGDEGEIINPADANSTIIVPFFPRGRLVGIGNGGPRGYRPGIGSNPAPATGVDVNNRLGYTHIGPTVEGNGNPGRWGRVYTPESRPWQLTGEAASNQLPVIESPDLIAITRTEMAP